MNVLEVHNVTKKFGNLVAVHDVSLNVAKGELRAVIGPNGAGKTTFFNLISGFFPPTSGSITFDGRDITTIPTHQRVPLGMARTFQGPDAKGRTVHRAGRCETRHLRGPGVGIDPRVRRVHAIRQIPLSEAAGRAVHIIADNLSTHKTKRVEEFLQNHPQVTLHYTPTYSSWLNQIELWFSKLERDVIARGIFTSRLDLKHKIMRYLRRYNKTAKPFKWSYRNASNRITPSSTLNVTVH